MRPGFAFDQRIEVRRVLDLLAPVVAARVRSHDALSIEDANPVGIGQDRQRLAYQGVGHRVVIEVEAYIRGLAHRDRDPFLQGPGVVRRGEQAGLLLGKGVPRRQGSIVRAEPVVGLAKTPRLGLAVEVGQVGVGARGEVVTQDPGFKFRGQGHGCAHSGRMG